MTLIDLLFWIYLYLLTLSICSALAFSPVGNSDHGAVLVWIGFPVNSKQDILFYCRADECSCADRDGFCDHLRDVLWEDIFKLSATDTASEFCGWV